MPQFRIAIQVIGLTKQYPQVLPEFRWTLKAIVETGKPSLGVRAMYVAFKLMEPFSPKKTLSTHWQ